MIPVALTASQEATLAALVQAGRLVRVAADPAKATRFLTSARTGLADLTGRGRRVDFGRQAVCRTRSLNPGSDTRQVQG